MSAKSALPIKKNLYRFLLAFLFSSVLAPGFAQVSVLMNHNDLQRTGANLSETLLNDSNVNVTNFGKLWTYPVGGQVYAQPLYVAGVNIPGIGTKNVLYVADMHNDIYAFDADDMSKANTPYWKKSYGQSVNAQDPQIGINYTDIRIEIGILSTPAVDQSTNTIYFVTKQKNTSGVISDTLRALDLSTGAPKFGGAQIISGTSGSATFVSPRQNQRAALLLSNNVLYVCYSSYGDLDPYHGWIFGYDPANINSQKILYCTTPTTHRGAIWMSGVGPSVDASGNLFVITGTGDTTYDNGESVLKLQPDLVNKTMTELDFFKPYNWGHLDSNDLDLGVVAPVLIPNTHVIVTAGKEGLVYVLDANNLGQFHSGGDQVLQEFSPIPGAQMGSPVVWGDSAANPNTALTYWWCTADQLKAYRYNYLTQQLNTLPFATGPSVEKPPAPGCMMSLSANGHTAGTGILWCSYPLGNAVVNTVSGVLRAFNANTLTEIWNSSQNATRDAVGSFAKFTPPTVVNGKVYMATFSGTVNVYGLLNPLPIVYSDFRASRVNTSVHLQWTTSSEQNNDYFEVQKSLDGTNFTKIGTVPGHLNTSIPHDYYFDDPSPMNGINYYRLRQVDVDSHASYSATISINMDLANNYYFHVYPNPAHDQVTIGCFGLKQGEIIDMEMYNSAGTLVYRQRIVAAGNDKIIVPRSRSMYTGVYFIRIVFPTGVSKEERLVWGS